MNKESSNLVKESLTENIKVHNHDNQGKKTWYAKLDRIMQKLDLGKFIIPKNSIKLVDKFTVKRLRRIMNYWEKRSQTKDMYISGYTTRRWVSVTSQ